MGVLVGVGVWVGVGVGIGVEVGVGRGVLVGVAVLVGVGMGVLVGATISVGAWASIVAWTPASTVACTSGAGEGVLAAIAFATAAWTIASMSGVGFWRGRLGAAHRQEERRGGQGQARQRSAPDRCVCKEPENVMDCAGCAHANLRL